MRHTAARSIERRRLRAVAAAVALAVALVSGVLDTSALAVTSPSTTTAAPASPTLPSTRAGQLAGAVLDVARRATLTESRYDELFASVFRTQVTSTQLLAGLAQAIGSSPKIERVLTSTPTAIEIVLRGPIGRVKLSLSAAGDGRIDGLLIRPYSEEPLPSSWKDVDAQLSSLAPRVSFTAAKVSADGTCAPVHEKSADTVGPLGSAFKLYVLGAVADAVRRGAMRWDDTIAIRGDWKSLPSGELQDATAGTKIAVTSMADKMISISDNTAADHLLRTVGRERVEAMQKSMGMRDVARNRPFLTTRELFVLKGYRYPSLARRYADASEAARRALLGREVVSASRLGVVPWTAPREIERVEWFASANDLCRALAWLATGVGRSSSTAVGHALSINDGGVDLDRATWPTVWFKGGSEPGVLTLAYLAKNRSGATTVVVVLLADPQKAFDEQAVATKLLAVVKGSFELL